MGRLGLMIARFVSGKLMPKWHYPVLAGPMKGVKIILGSLSGDGGGASVYFGRVEPEQTLSMAAELRPGHVVFDIGANVGYYSLLASRSVGETGRVIAFEPVIRNLMFLQRHLEINRASNVTVLPFAVSSDDRLTRFDLGKNGALGHIDESGESDVIVSGITIDRISTEMGISPNIIKIDVEGNEKKVLLGASDILRSSRPVIFLSTHSEELRSWCLSHLADLGYEVEPLVPSGDSHEFVAR